MANTYIQIHLHIVFAVKHRDAMLHDDWRDELFRYIGGVIRNHGYIPIKIGGVCDHVHILVGCKAQIDISSLVKDIKISTNKWIQPRCKCRFAWQDGFGCFSISCSHLDAVSQYIENQPVHHKQINFTGEFKRLLFANGVEYDDRYLPQEPE